AVKFGDKIFAGPTHYMAYMKAYDQGNDLPEGYDPNSEGFVTDSGRFIGRNEAWNVAKVSGQSNRTIQGHGKFRPETLTSEDIAPQDIHAGAFEKNTGIKLSENPEKMIHPMGVLLGPRHANPRR